ncbi:MAG: hypothetical protein JXA93_05215, partial [Anaerolineae bacterium]|nr:hypothetical protein [Anaerolineae bacterium]
MNVRAFTLFGFCATLVLLLGMAFTVALAAPGHDASLPSAASTPVGFPPFPTPPVPVEPPAPPARMEPPLRGPGQDADNPQSQLERIFGDRLPEGWRKVLAQGGDLPDGLTTGTSPEAWGGPDSFGYTYADSNEPWGPDPTFEDISGVGTAIDLTDFYTAVTLPFAFPFYDSTYAEVYLYGDCLYCWNYWTHLAFGGPDPHYYGGSVRWMDYIDRDSGTVYVYSDTLSSPARFIVQYDEVWNYSYGITTTSQVILYETGDILVRYAEDFDWWSWYWWDNAPWLFWHYTSFRYQGDPHNNLAVQFYYPQGAWLWPPEQTQAAPAGGETSYVFDLHNDTGATDSFSLTVNGHIWPTYVSPTQTGPIADGGVMPIQVLVDLPPGTMPGDTDAATIHATSVTSPGIYSDTTAISTIAVCTPSLIFSGQSAQAVSHDEIFDYGGQQLTHLYVNAHTTSDWPTMNATLLAYDPGLAAWQTLGEWQSIGPHYLLIDQYDIPPIYSAVHLRLRDTWGLPAYYDYQFIACREPAVALHPLAQQALVLPGTTVVYTQTVTNYTMGPDSFDLSVASNAWPTTFWDGPTPIDTTGPLADLETFTFTVQVEVPASMGAEHSDSATIQATSATSPGINDTASLHTSLLTHPWAQAFFEGWAPDGSPDGEHYLDIVRPTGVIRAQVTDDTDWQYEAPAVAAYPRDALVAAWRGAYHWNGTAGYYNVEYAGLDLAGNVVISTTQVSDNISATLYTEDWGPTLAVAPTDGNVLFAWTRYEDDFVSTYHYNVYYAVRDPDGTEVLAPTALTTNATADTGDYYPSVASFGDGHQAVAWQHWDNTTGTYDIYYAVLDSAGSLVTPPTNLTQNSGESDYEPRANRLADGNVLLTWNGWHGPGSEIRYAVLDSAGGVVHPITPLAGSSQSMYRPDAVGLRNGHTLVAWEQYGYYPDWGRHLGYALLDSAYQAPTNPGEGP